MYLMWMCLLTGRLILRFGSNVCLYLKFISLVQFISSHFCVFCIFFEVQKSQIQNIFFGGKGALEVVEVEEEHE